MRDRIVIGHRLFVDGAVRAVYQDDRGQYVLDDGERIDGLFIVPEEDEADTPLILNAPRTPDVNSGP
jgi:hypothetical protein